MLTSLKGCYDSRLDNTTTKVQLTSHEPSSHPAQGSKPTGLDSKLETPEQRFLKGKLLSLKSYRNFSNLFANTDKWENGVRAIK